MSWKAEDDDVLRDTHRIVRIYAEENRTVVVADHGSTYVEKHLNEVEAIINCSGFVRISKDELVNCKRIQGICKGLTGCSLKMDNGSQMFVAKKFVPEIKQKIKLK